MKYSVALFALVAGVFALPQEDASSITSAPAASASLDPQIASLINCVNSCSAGDVTCQAQCAGVARPNASQAIETNECAAKCDQGDGSQEDTEAYAKCQTDCFASLFPSTQTVAPFVAGAVSSAVSSLASAASSATGTGARSTNASGSPTGTASSGDAANTGAASAHSVKVLGAGLAGVMAIFAM